MRILVCGGRDYSDAKGVKTILDEYKIDLIIQGGATGADRLAYDYAVENNIEVETYMADWKKHKKAAGPIRNKQMLVEGKPDLVIAFPGGKGTQNMLEQAKRAKVDCRMPLGFN